MSEKTESHSRRAVSLSRERIIAAAIEILDDAGPSGLTFQVLAKRLSTGPGAIYWHIAGKAELLTAACDTLVGRILGAIPAGATPEARLCGVALALFDGIDRHPWVGSALTQSGGQLPMVRIFDRIGQELGALGVAPAESWTAASALLNYILGVGGQNAANAQFARQHGLQRQSFLDAVAQQWAELDPAEFPFARSVAGALRGHDDRVDFMAGIEFLLAGIKGSRPD